MCSRELVEGIEEYEPSVMACVVLLDRETSTLHPGAGPSLPPHWLEAIDGVVIGPNIGSCGSAAWSGELAISADISDGSQVGAGPRLRGQLQPAPLLVDADQGR